MNGNRLSIEELRIELERLQLALHNIKRLIHQTEEEDQEQQQEQADPAEAGNRQRTFIIDEELNRRAGINYNEDHPVVHDWRDCEILIGDSIRFLTRGRYDSREGIVYKISNNGARVTARDDRGRSISRAPRNVEVIASRQEE